MPQVSPMYWMLISLIMMNLHMMCKTLYNTKYNNKKQSLNKIKMKTTNTLW